MSRSNPYKKKKRYAKRTLLIFGEGFDEEVFLKYLKGLYSQNANISVTIRKGKGGSAGEIVICTHKEPGAFDRRIVVFDCDKPKKEMQQARQEAKTHNIELIENEPCLEFLLLSILCKATEPNKDSKWFKKEFEGKYMDEKKRNQLTEYSKLFPKKLLDSKKSKISNLKRLISVMEGK